MVLSCGMTTPRRFWHIGSRQNHYKSLANRVVCSQYRSAFRSCWGSRPSRWLAVNLTEQYAAISIHTRPRSSWWEDWSRGLIKSGLVVTTLMADALRWVILSNNICDTDWIPLQFSSCQDIWTKVYLRFPCCFLFCWSTLETFYCVWQIVDLPFEVFMNTFPRNLVPVFRAPTKQLLTKKMVLCEWQFYTVD